MRQAAFPFEVLDVKDALVGAPHVYELDLMNRRALAEAATFLCCGLPRNPMLLL